MPVRSGPFLAAGFLPVLRESGGGGPVVVVGSLGFPISSSFSAVLEFGFGSLCISLCVTGWALSGTHARPELMSAFLRHLGISSACCGLRKFSTSILMGELAFFPSPT